MSLVSLVLVFRYFFLLINTVFYTSLCWAGISETLTHFLFIEEMVISVKRKKYKKKSLTHSLQVRGLACEAEKCENQLKCEIHTCTRRINTFSLLRVHSFCLWQDRDLTVDVNTGFSEFNELVKRDDRSQTLDPGNIKMSFNHVS